jgi:hypothetical protein
MLEFGQMFTETEFALQQMCDCLTYKITHNYGVVVLIIIGLYMIWRVLRPDVRGAG